MKMAHVLFAKKRYEFHLIGLRDTRQLIMSHCI